MKYSVASLFALILASQAYAADPKQTMDPKQMEMMQKYEAAAKPGESHKILADLAGKWKTKSKMWHAPEAKPEESTGTAKMKMTMGGRWLEQEFKGSAMGKPFEGRGMLGYDNVKGHYASVWTDTMSTGPMIGEGTFDPSTKTIKESGKMSCPVSADKTQDYRSELQIVDKNKLVFSMFGSAPTGGPEFKMMEIVYTR